MPDYNKGDFTQQGYDGYVSGGLHLNEKRCLTTKISTDEETAGIDSIEINIHDHLNDLDYTITGENLEVGENVLPSGNIAITENTPEGETLDISQYATATVNVSGENVLYCAVTFVPDENKQIDIIPNSIMIEDKTLEYVAISKSIRSEATMLFPYLKSGSEYEIPIYYADGSVITATNAVNCIYDDGVYVVTDPTLVSSITLSGYSPSEPPIG